MMNKKYLLYAALAGTMFSACSDDLGIDNKGVIKNPGDVIVFSGMASYEVKGDVKTEEEVKTRTVYTGGKYTDENGHVFEPVEWISGDQVRIYCDNAHGSKYADYSVTETDADVDAGKKDDYKHKTGLYAVSEGLKWGDGSQQHTFYSVYPSPLQHDNGVEDKFFEENNTLVGYIPYYQNHIGVTKTEGAVDNSDVTVDNAPEDFVKPGNGVLYTIHPNMDYAYMVAKTVVPRPNDLGENEYVSLDYIPVTTAVEITLRHVAWKEGADIEPFQLLNVQLSSVNGEKLFGGFTADLNNLTMVENKAVSIPKVDIANDIQNGTSVSLSMRNEDGTPITLQYGDAVKFTAFLLPNTDIENINVTIGGIEGQHTGKITGIKIEKHKKTYLKQVPITGDVLPFTLANWMRWVNGNVLVRELSIPGAGGAASYNLSANGYSELTVNDETYSIAHNMVRQQTASIEEQWKRGVRAFEFSVDVNGTATTANLGESPVLCSGISTGLKLSEAVAKVREMLNTYPHECAMAIITYETSGGWSGATRNPSLFMTQLDNYWDLESAVTKKNDTYGITVQTALYDPTLTVMNEARGKLFCIARPTSEHQDYGYDVLDLDGYNYASTDSANINIGKKMCIDTDAPVSYTKMGLPAINDHIMVIHGWGPLKDKWQQRGYTNYSIRSEFGSRSANGNGKFKFLGWDGKGVVGEDNEEPYRPFDGSNLTKNASGNIDASDFTVITSEGDKEETYKITIIPTKSNDNTNLSVSGVTIGGNDATPSGSNWVIDYGKTKPTGNLEVVVNFTCSYNNSNTSSTKEYSETISLDSYSYYNYVHTFTASATRSWGSYKYSYDITGPTDGNSSSDKYTGTLPSVTKNTIDLTNHTADFTYPVVSGSNTSNAWVQEWARVSNTDKIFQIPVSDAKCYVVNWGQSYNEKLKNIKDAMTLAVNRKTNGKAAYTFINSLSGYYITEKYAPSVFPCALTDCGFSSNGQYPLKDPAWNYQMWMLSSASTIAGMGGDISGYANDVNKAIYEYMTTDADYKEGSLGIIILDRVNETTYGKAIASMVVGTNFLFDIEHSDSDSNNQTENGSTNEEDGDQLARPRGAVDNTNYTVEW